MGPAFVERGNIMSGFNKVVHSYEEALAGFKDGMTVMAGTTR